MSNGNDTATERKMDPREALILDMVKSMAGLSSNIVLLIAKVEDMTAALDDHRSAMEALTESTDALSGMIDTTLNVADELSEIGVKNEEKVTWRDLQTVLSGMREETGEEDEEEEK